MSRLTLLCLDIPNSSPGSLRDWSLRIIQGSAQLVPAQRVIHKPWKANHAYDRFLFHRNVRFSSCHCTKGPSSLTCAFPPLSARISFSFLLVHSGKNLTCHEAWTQARRAGVSHSFTVYDRTSPHTTRKHRLSLESLTNDVFTKLWAVNGLPQVVREVKNPPANAG